MRKSVGYLQKIQIGVGGFFLSVFLLAVLIQITSRYMAIPMMWAEEVARYSFIWAAFMGAGAMVYEDKHFAFTSVYDNLKNEKIKIVLKIIIAIIMLIFSVLMLYYGFLISKKFWNYTWINVPIFKRGPTWLCLPICGLTSSIYLIDSIIAYLKKLLSKGDV